MANVPTDWAWPALIQSLQHDIVRLHETVESMRKETSAARDRHREELDDLIDQLRQVRTELDPIITERQEAQKVRREVVWRWLEKGGWIAVAGIGFAVWHYLTKHLGSE